MKKFYVASSHTHGRGFFAAKDFEKNEHISYIIGRVVKCIPKTKADARAMKTWFGLTRQFWIDPQNRPFRYINHSCGPNAGIIGTKTLVAIRRIRKDEEITIDYSMSDADSYLAMRCTCGSAQCRKIIRPIQALPFDVYKRNLPYVPRYFQHLYLRSCGNSRIKTIGKRQRYVAG